MRKSFLALAAIGCAGAIALACGDDDDGGATIGNPDSGIGSSGSSGSTGSSGSGTSSGSPGDDDDLADAAPITDGGVNIDPDASDDEDSGPDAAPCNALGIDAGKINSRCQSVIPGFNGGALVAGTYHLVRVDALGSQQFCGNTFNAIPIAETLELTVDGQGVGTAQTVTVVANRAPKTTTLTLDPPDSGASPLVLTPVCPSKKGDKVPYTSNAKSGKQTLVLQLGYGNGGQALYHFEK